MEKMSLPFEKRCKYPGCGIYFMNVHEVITHILQCHFDLGEWDAKVVPALPGNTELVLNLHSQNCRFQAPGNELDSTMKKHFCHSYAIVMHDHLEDLKISSFGPAIPMPAILPMVMVEHQFNESPPEGVKENPDKQNFVPLSSTPTDSDNSESHDTMQYSDSEQELELLEILEFQTQMDAASIEQTCGQQGPSTNKSNEKRIAESVPKLTRKKRPYSRKYPIIRPKSKVIKKENSSPEWKDDEGEGEYYSKEFIMGHAMRAAKIAKQRIKNDEEDCKLYKCPVPGCPKHYKNANGIRYHAKHSHKGPLKLDCDTCGQHCGSVQGLVSHSTKHVKKEKFESPGKVSECEGEAFLDHFKIEPEYLSAEESQLANSYNLNNQNPSRKRKSPLTNNGSLMYDFAPFPATYIKTEIEES